MKVLLRGNDARWAARELIRVGAVRIDENNPFAFRSGIRSPIKIDFDRVAADEVTKDFFTRCLAENLPQYLRQEYELPVGQLTFVGVPGGGTPWAEALAKGLAANSAVATKTVQFAGEVGIFFERRTNEQFFVVVEDVVTLATSTAQLTQLIHDAKGKCKVAVSLFSYGFTAAERRLHKLQVKHITLLDWNLLHKELSQAFTQKEIDVVDGWYQSILRLVDAT